MPKTRREFAFEFKRETVALLESSGRPLMQVATEVGISPSMARNLARATITGGGSIPPSSTGPRNRPNGKWPKPVSTKTGDHHAICVFLRDVEQPLDAERSERLTVKGSRTSKIAYAESDVSIIAQSS